MVRVPYSPTPMSDNNPSVYLNEKNWKVPETSTTLHNQELQLQQPLQLQLQQPEQIQLSSAPATTTAEKAQYAVKPKGYTALLRGLRANICVFQNLSRVTVKYPSIKSVQKFNVPNNVT